MNDQAVSNRRKKLSKLQIKIVLGLVIVLALAGGFAFQITANNNLKKENKRLSNPQAAAQAETSSLVADVGKLIVLPQGEAPTIATVVEASKLKSQAFFGNAQNGDKVLLYAQAKKAILYRPSTNKIIEVAPINIGNNATTPAASSTTTPSSTPAKR